MNKFHSRLDDVRRELDEICSCNYDAILILSSGEMRYGKFS